MENVQELSAMWREQLQAQQALGSGFAASCKQEGVSACSVYAWRKRLSLRPATVKSIRVPVARMGPLLEMQTPGGYALRLSAPNRSSGCRRCVEVRLGCLAHLRRRFDEALKVQEHPTGRAKQALEYIGKLYQIEKEHVATRPKAKRQSSTRIDCGGSTAAQCSIRFTPGWSKTRRKSCQNR